MINTYSNMYRHVWYIRLREQLNNYIYLVVLIHVVQKSFRFSI